MLKKSAIKKILISSLAFLLISILCLFPDSTYNKSTIVEHHIKESSIITLYIPNMDNYVSRITMIKKEKDTIDVIKEIISYLTINNKNDYLPSFVDPIIPKNTKVLGLDLNDKLLKINFSKEFLNIPIDRENKLIESIVYSITELEEVDKIMIFVEGNILDKLPNSNKRLSTILDRHIGINTIYDINNYKDTMMVTTYFIAKNDNYYYYIPISKVLNKESEKIEVIISELKSAPIYHTNLMSFLNANVELLDYEITENEILLSFNNYIFEDFNNKNILEEVKYSISLSIKDSYNINTVVFKNIDN